jgi:uncharacterized membrane protein
MSNLSLLNTTDVACGVGGDTGLSDIAIGVVAALCGSFVLAIGMVGQRYAHVTLARKRPDALYVTDPTWIVFFLVFLVGNLGDLVALSFAPQSVVTPLGSMSLVSNAIVARFLLKEKIDLNTLLGGAIVVCGVGAIVMPSILREPCTFETAHTLSQRWSQPAFITWAACQISVIFACVYAIGRIEHKALGSQGEAGGRGRWTDAFRGASVSAIESLSIRDQKLLRILHVLATGLIASWTVLFLKCAGELGKASARAADAGHTFNPLLDGRSYGLVAAVALTLPSQLHLLNKSLQRFEAQFVVPALQGFWSISSITKGALFFGEFDLYTSSDTALFVSGVLLTLAGVALLSTRKPASSASSESGSANQSAKAKQVAPTKTTSAPAILSSNAGRRNGGAVMVGA